MMIKTMVISFFYTLAYSSTNYSKKTHDVFVLFEKENDAIMAVDECDGMVSLIFL